MQHTDLPVKYGAGQGQSAAPVRPTVSPRPDRRRRGASNTDNKTVETGKHPLYQELESRRAYPRVKLRLPVQIGLSGGQVVCAHIYNMSPDGIQIRCEPEAALAINPSGRAIAPGDGPRILVAMRLHDGQDMRTLVVRCRVSYVLPESPREVIIGLSFEELVAAQRDAIDAALSASLMPREM